MWDLYKYQEVGIKIEMEDGLVYRLDSPHVILRGGRKVSLIGVDLEDIEVCEEWLSTLEVVE